MRLSPPALFRTANAWVAAAAVSLLFATGLATAPIATAETCDNATLRAQNNSTALPDCRAYEMVTPPYKEGFPVGSGRGYRFTDGIISFGALGNFAGNVHSLEVKRYRAIRSATGWATTPANVLAESADMRWSLVTTSRPELPGDTEGYWLLGPDGGLTRIGDAVDALGPQFFVGVSADLSHVVFNHGFQSAALFEYVGVGNGPDAREVSVDNDGVPTPAINCLSRVSDDGRVIVYTAGCAIGVPQVWARVAGSASVLVSGSECTRGPGDPDGACNGVSPAQYEGAAADGSRVFFTTDRQLVNGDVDQTRDLYACDIPDGAPVPVGSSNPCASLTEVSGVASGAQVASVPVVSKDGSRVYFVAEGAALVDNLGVTGATAVAGQSNLYVWVKDAAHPAGQVRFVAKLDTDDLVGAGLNPQLTPDNRYLLFTTATGLVGEGPGADSDGARDVYRYDASTHAIVRVSTSVSGGGGNDPGFDASLGRDGRIVAMSSDGSTVIFETAEALSEADTDGVTDVYSWRDGQVSLISAGGGSVVGISSSGRDIFFVTQAPVLAADGDVITDVYTARVGGGFEPSRPAAPCAGDGCQGLLSGVPGLVAPRSGLSGDSDPGDAVAVVSLRSVSAAQRRRLAATGKLSLTVAANTAGRVTATARAKIGGGSVTVGSARRTITRPGSVAVTLRLSRSARTQLARRGRLTVRVLVSHSKASRGRSVTLKLTRARAKSSVGGRS